MVQRFCVYHFLTSRFSGNQQDRPRPRSRPQHEGIPWLRRSDSGTLGPLGARERWCPRDPRNMGSKTNKGPNKNIDTTKSCHMSIPIGSMVLVYMLTLGVYWWDPCYHIYHTWILWDSLFFNLSNFYGKFPWKLGMFPSHLFQPANCFRPPSASQCWNLHIHALRIRHNRR